MEDYVAVNLANWNSRVPHHANGEEMQQLRADCAALSDVVRFDQPRLGDITGLDVLHLQCHVGADTLSLARLGARVTGLDFSAPALEVARALARDCDANIAYVESEVYGAVEALCGACYDLIYTGVGALCWLPSISRWASVVSELLRPGGRLFVREAHPIVWALGDPRPDGLLSIEYPYFETAEGTEFFDTNDYGRDRANLDSPRSIGFNHGLGEIVSGIMAANLDITSLEEHRSLPWNPFGAAGTAVGHGEFALRVKPDRLPASYTLQASKRAV